MKPCLLFLPPTTAALMEYLVVMEYIEKDDRFQPAIFADGLRQTMFAPILAKEGRSIINPSGKTGAPPPTLSSTSTHQPPPKSTLRSSRLRTLIFPWIPSIMRLFLLRLGQIRRARAILRKCQARAVVVPSDRRAGWELAFVKAAEHLGIPTVIVPYAVDFKTGIAICRRKMPEYTSTIAVHGPLRTIVAWLFPHWTFTYAGERMFFYPLQEAIVALLLGMIPTDPWVPGGGHSTLLAAESVYTRDLFVRYGITPEKIVVTGKPSTDRLVRSQSTEHIAAIRREWNITATATRVILCSVPQFGEHGIIPWKEHWRDTETLLAALAAFPNTILVLTLHPKCDPAAYEPYAKKYDAIIATHPVYDIIPACDIYVAAASSTVTQAIAAHRPTIVVDVHRADREQFYDNAPGVQVVHEWQGLRPAVERLLTDSSFYERHVRAQKERGAEWAPMDGHCTKRVCACITKLATQRA